AHKYICSKKYFRPAKKYFRSNILFCTRIYLVQKIFLIDYIILLINIYAQKNILDLPKNIFDRIYYFAHEYICSKKYFRPAKKYFRSTILFCTRIYLLIKIFSTCQKIFSIDDIILHTNIFAHKNIFDLPKNIFNQLYYFAPEYVCS